VSLPNLGAWKTAIRSFFRYATLEVPEHAGTCQRVLAIPSKREPRALVGFLNRAEIEALFTSPDQATFVGFTPVIQGISARGRAANPSPTAHPAAVPENLVNCTP
jgi:hypothetical protein